MRELARQLVSEAREAMESATRCEERPPQWVQAFMSPAGLGTLSAAAKICDLA